jgi:iron(III) transport system substrate-binding protein
MLLRTNRRRLLQVCAVATASAVALSGCGGGAGSGGSATGSTGDWASVVAAAADEGSVTYYTNTAPDQSQPLIAAFKAKYPNITVNYVRGAAELETKLDAEIGNGLDGADVVVMTHREWNVRHAPDFLPLRGLVPAVDNWPRDGWTVPDLAPSASVTPMGIIAWNTTQFPNGFKDWNDLLAPDVAGKIGFRDTVDATVAGYMQFLQSANGDDWLNSFARQKPRFYPSVVPMAQAVASGEIGVAAISIPSTLVALKAQGAPIDWIIPNKTFALQAPVMILKKTERPNASRVFTDFLLSPEGQAAFNGKKYGSSVVPGTPGALDLSGDQVTLLDPAVTTPQAVTDWGTRFKQLFNR